MPLSKFFTLEFDVLNSSNALRIESFKCVVIQGFGLKRYYLLFNMCIDYQHTTHSIMILLISTSLNHLQTTLYDKMTVMVPVIGLARSLVLPQSIYNKEYQWKCISIVLFHVFIRSSTRVAMLVSLSPGLPSLHGSPFIDERTASSSLEASTHEQRVSSNNC